MRKLAVLNFENATVHFHDIDREYIDEKYVQNLGYNLDNCQWMFGDLEIIKHKGVLL